MPTPPPRKPAPLTPDRLDLILESLAVGVFLEPACKAVGVDPQAVKDLAAEDAEFRKRYVDALMAGGDARSAAPELHPMPAPPVFVDMPSGCAYVEASTGHPCSLPCGHGGRHEPKAPSKPVDAPAPRNLREVARMVADAQEDEEGPPSGSRIVLVSDYADDYARVMAEAADMFGPGRLGLLKWVDMRTQIVRPALHAIEPAWMDAAEEYYDSGLLVMLTRKGLRAGGSSTACPMLARCAAFGHRRLDGGTIGAIPIMSATRDEADGRFVTIRTCLRAMGLTPPPKKRGRKSFGEDEDFGTEEDEDGQRYEVPPGGIAGIFQSKRSQSGGGIIAIRDRHGHRIQFRILPALVRHGVGYTGVAGFADESDLWPNDPEHHVNPAEKIYSRISERFTTTWRAVPKGSGEDPGAEFLIFSASYNPDSAHKRAIEDVDALSRGQTLDREPIFTPDIAHLARMGARAAQRDEALRRELAEQLGSEDPRLLAPGDPMSPDFPTWVFNPPETIQKCYRFSNNNLSRMLGMYGGRAAENAGASDRPFVGIEIPVDERGLRAQQVVLGVAPPDETSGEWGIVAVGIMGEGLLVTDDASGIVDAVDAEGAIRQLGRDRFANVIAVASGQERRVEGEIAAAWAGGGIPVAPVVAEKIHDGGTLRTGPARTLYQRGSLRHVPRLGALERALRAWTPETRSPRVEALSAAVARLIACYPWLGRQEDQEPIRGPRPRGALVAGVASEPVTGPHGNIPPQHRTH